MYIDCVINITNLQAHVGCKQKNTIFNIAFSWLAGEKSCAKCIFQIHLPPTKGLFQCHITRLYAVKSPQQLLQGLSLVCSKTVDIEYSILVQVLCTSFPNGFRFKSNRNTSGIIKRWESPTQRVLCIGTPLADNGLDSTQRGWRGKHFFDFWLPTVLPSLPWLLVRRNATGAIAVMVQVCREKTGKNTERKSGYYTQPLWGSYCLVSIGS